MAKFWWMLCLVISLNFLIGCADQKQRTKPDPVALMAKVAQLEEHERSTALVSYAFLYPQKAPSRFSAIRTSKASAVEWSTLGSFVEYVSRNVQDGLPVPLEELKAGVSAESLAALSEVKSVLLARYFGPKLKEDKHVIQFARLARNAAGKPSFVLDLSTRTLLSVTAFDALLEEPTRFFSEQVIPGVERSDTGGVTFFTRGMVKFGLPDLEQGGVEVAVAKRTFNEFQASVRLALERTTLKIGDKLGNGTLGSCLRPQNAIERECVRIVELQEAEN